MGTEFARMAQSISGSDALKLAHAQQARSWFWALAATLLVLGLVYAPNFRDLSWYWFSDPNYSHGPLVIPIAALILWRRLSTAKEKLTPNVSTTAYWGWVFLVVVLALRLIAYERSMQWSENATIVPAIACLTWIFGGWPLLRLAWPAIAFLVFMFPLPRSINNSISLPLQEIATAGSCFLLQLSNIWVVQHGNTIQLMTKTHEMERLEVAAACNGLSMLMTLAATVTATIIVIPLPTWKRIVILASAVPIALVTNILRIVATGWCYCYIPRPTAKDWAHDIAGWLMMPLALVLVALELRILSWLVPEETLGEGYDLRLMPSVNSVNDIPSVGEKLIIVAAVNNVLHFRMFDVDGNVVANTDEKRLRGQVRQIMDLKKRLESLWPPHELTARETGHVVSAVSSVIGRTSGEYEGKLMVRALSEEKNAAKRKETQRKDEQRGGLRALFKRKKAAGSKETQRKNEENVILPALINKKKKKKATGE